MTRDLLENFIGWGALVGIVLTGVASCLGPVPARAQDHHHPLHEDFYKTWKQPDNPVASCCDARIEEDGNEKGDCEPAPAEVRNGDWWVYVRQIKQWLRVPDSKIIHERNPNGQDAHLCWTPYAGIMCFNPADTGF